MVRHVRLATPQTPTVSGHTDTSVLFEDQIQQQLQADLASLKHSFSDGNSPIKESKKRKSHDLTADGHGGSRSEKSGEKRRKRRRERLLQDPEMVDVDRFKDLPAHQEGQSLAENRGLSPEIPPTPTRQASVDEVVLGEPRRAVFTSVNDPKKSTKMARKEKEAHKSMAPETPEPGDPTSALRKSLGTKHNALMATIFKSCSPDRAKTSGPQTTPQTGGIGPSASVSRPAKKRHRISYAFKLPAGYSPVVEGEETKWNCPVDTCDKSYSRKDTLCGHINERHVDLGQLLQENGDGTMTVTGSRPKVEGASAENATKMSSAGAAQEKAVHAATQKPMTNGTSAEAKKQPSRSKRSRNVAKRTAIPSPKFNAKSIATPSDDDDADEEDAVSSDGKEPLMIKSKRRRSTEQAADPASGATRAQYRKDSLMEDWELNSGKIQLDASSRSAAATAADDDDDDDDDDDVRKYIAFSSKVTVTSSPTTQSPIRLPCSATFRVQHVPAGSSSIRYELGTGGLYSLFLCSVASGKVNVAILAGSGTRAPLDTGRTAFDIGPHGMWTITGGQACVITNRGYTDAFVHISKIAGAR
ncbi:MAG: hypothetical protein M1818_002311 [Claussenomyces sp. TS43310]|nr:MAG: hypothetical protein M1818_002311 [Claussenomyces sp. TS43310]